MRNFRDALRAALAVHEGSDLSPADIDAVMLDLAGEVLEDEGRPVAVHVVATGPGDTTWAIRPVDPAP